MFRDRLWDGNSLSKLQSSWLRLNETLEGLSTQRVWHGAVNRARRSGAIHCKITHRNKMHISASTAPIRMKQKPLYSQLNAERYKHYYNSLFKRLENSPESLLT